MQNKIWFLINLEDQSLALFHLLFCAFWFKIWNPSQWKSDKPAFPCAELYRKSRSKLDSIGSTHSKMYKRR